MTTPKDEKGAEPAPFAFWVYVPDEQRGEFVHDLDDAIDDLTNCKCEVTNLYDHPPGELDSARVREALAPMLAWTEEGPRVCDDPFDRGYASAQDTARELVLAALTSLKGTETP
jgi:hypothetical protein